MADHTDTRKKKMSGKKKALIAGGIVVGVLLLCVLILFLIIRGYLKKVQYDPGDQSLVDSLPPEDESAGPDSPASEIDKLESDAQSNIENNKTPLAYDKDVFNVMLIGSDTRVSGRWGRSDTMMLLSINKKTNKIVVTSLLRDIYLNIPGVSQGNRLNTATAYGGPSLLMKTVEQNFRIKVDKYVAVDFYNFIDIIDHLGGIELDLNQSEVDIANKYIREINRLTGKNQNDGLLTAPGVQTVTGKQALGYARNRYGGGGDFSRTNRQRIVLEKCFDKVKNQSVGKLGSLLNTFLPMVRTNLTEGEMFSLIWDMPKFAGYEVDSWSVPMSGAYKYMTVRGMSVLGIDFDKCVAEMQTRIYG